MEMTLSLLWLYHVYYITYNTMLKSLKIFVSSTNVIFGESFSDIMLSQACAQVFALLCYYWNDVVYKSLSHNVAVDRSGSLPQHLPLNRKQQMVFLAPRLLLNYWLLRRLQTTKNRNVDAFEPLQCQVKETSPVWPKWNSVAVVTLES